MPIHLPESTVEGLSLVRAHVPSLLWRTKSGLASADDIESSRIAKPHPIYNAYLQSFLDGTVLSSAKLTAWQYLIVRGEVVRWSAEVRIGGEGEANLIFAALHESPRGDALQSTIMEAETIPRVREVDYQLRILRAPAVNLYALWLHAMDDDVLIPVPPVHSGLEANKVYTEEQMTDHLLPAAKQQATISNEEMVL